MAYQSDNVQHRPTCYFPSRREGSTFQTFNSLSDFAIPNRLAPDSNILPSELNAMNCSLLSSACWMIPSDVPSEHFQTLPSASGSHVARNLASSLNTILVP